MKRRQFLKGLLAAPACASGALAAVAAPMPLAAIAGRYCDLLARKGGIMLLSKGGGMFEDLGDAEWTEVDFAERWRWMAPLFQTPAGRGSLATELRRRCWLHPRDASDLLRDASAEANGQ